MRSPRIDPATIIEHLRRLVLLLLAWSMLATAIDLYLLGHYEDPKQWLPLVALASGLAAVAWCAVGESTASLRVLQVVMAACVVLGIVGVVLHYRGNMEFQLEIDPSIGAWALFTTVVRAKAPPTMAPGAMAQLGLLGLIYTYRHPALIPRGPSPDASESSR